MNVLIKDMWLYAIELNPNDNEFAVEIPTDCNSLFNDIFDNAHKTHGRAENIGVPYATLLQENNGKGKSTSKCKVGIYDSCWLDRIAIEYHKGFNYGFFKYEVKREC